MKELRRELTYQDLLNACNQQKIKIYQILLMQVYEPDFIYWKDFTRGNLN